MLTGLSEGQTISFEKTVLFVEGVLKSRPESELSEIYDSLTEMPEEARDEFFLLSAVVWSTGMLSPDGMKSLYRVFVEWETTEFSVRHLAERMVLSEIIVKSTEVANKSLDEAEKVLGAIKSYRDNTDYIY